VDAPVSTASTTQESGLAFFRPFLPLFGTIFFCLLSVDASLATPSEPPTPPPDPHHRHRGCYPGSIEV
jgi:hypothetical protein